MNAYPGTAILSNSNLKESEKSTRKIILNIILIYPARPSRRALACRPQSPQGLPASAGAPLGRGTARSGCFGADVSARLA